MSDYISREAAINALAKIILESDMPEDWNKGMDDAMSALFGIPAADVRPVVLCRDCYAYRRDKELAEAAYLDPEMYCGLLRCEMGEDSFCSYGKRKGEKT